MNTILLASLLVLALGAAAVPENPYVSAMMRNWHEEKERLVADVTTCEGCGPPGSNKHLWDAFEIADTLAVKIEALEAQLKTLQERLDLSSMGRLVFGGSHWAEKRV